MARKQITQLLDDIDGTILEDGGETVLFSLDDQSYEIDLSKDHAEELRTVLSPYVSVARSTRASGPSRTSRVRPARSSSGRDLNAVREWARANGHTVSERGRVAATIIEAYDAVN